MISAVSWETVLLCFWGRISPWTGGKETIQPLRSAGLCLLTNRIVRVSPHQFIFTWILSSHTLLTKPSTKFLLLSRRVYKEEIYDDADLKLLAYCLSCKESSWHMSMHKHEAATHTYLCTHTSQKMENDHTAFWTFKWCLAGFSTLVWYESNLYLVKAKFLKF